MEHGDGDSGNWGGPPPALLRSRARCRFRVLVDEVSPLKCNVYLHRLDRPTRRANRTVGLPTIRKARGSTDSVGGPSRKNEASLNLAVDRKSTPTGDRRPMRRSANFVCEAD